MQRRSTHIILIALLALVIGSFYGVHGFDVGNGLVSVSQCEKSIHNGRSADISAGADMEKRDVSSTSSAPATAVPSSCSASAPMVPSEQLAVPAPAENQNHRLAASCLYPSQTVIFQEPDPPRIG